MLGAWMSVGLAAAAPAAHEQISGVWRISAPVRAVLASDGKEPPLLPDAAQHYRERMASLKKGDRSFDGAMWCASPGEPRLMLMSSPFQIMVNPSYVGIMHQWNWWARVVYLNNSLSPDAVALPSAMGLSVGKWQGDTLIIETTQLLDTTLLDNAGLPHSSSLKVTERLRLLGKNTLEDRIQFDDPKTFAHPWETVVQYRRQIGSPIHEDVCLDRVRDGKPAIGE